MKNRACIAMAALLSFAIMLATLPALAAEAPATEATATATEATATEVTETEAPEGEDPDSWQFEFTPYIFAARLDGKVTVNRVNADVDMGFDDILDHLNSAFMGTFEVRKGPWSFMVDGVYLKLEDENARSWEGLLGNTNTGTLEMTITEQVYHLLVGYRVADDRVKVDLMGVARATLLDTEMDLTVTTGATLLPDGSRSVSGSESWVDPAIGVRLMLPFSKTWTVVGYGDIGGFGVGSDISAQLMAGINWQFSKVVSAKLGYRYLYQDYEDDDFAWDMTSSGFYLGAGFRF